MNRPACITVRYYKDDDEGYDENDQLRHVWMREHWRDLGGPAGSKMRMVKNMMMMT